MMMLSAKNLRVALVTIHTPLHSVAKSITQERIIEAAKILDGALRTDFGIEAPRIALAGLNPHAGENGSIGSEEIEIINPAAAALRADGIDITDAQSADTLFHEEARKNYDAALCMYHDQGLIPVKTLDFHGGVNTTLGLPVIRTSPDHGTAFDIAGKGVARPDSLIQAIKAARQMADQRAISA
jgi:4-hydroxythreonine-4-phosphate dehydrogenase